MTTTGWSCPKCSRVYAPYIPECSHCNRQESSLAIEQPIVRTNIIALDSYSQCPMYSHHSFGRQGTQDICIHCGYIYPEVMQNSSDPLTNPVYGR